MEMASYLAGERWSDHPRCTHPLLAVVARLVNDHTSDRHRTRLSELVPSVIGLTTTDPRARRLHRPALCHDGAADRIRRTSARDGRVRAGCRADACHVGRPPGRRSPTVEHRRVESAPLAASWARSFVSPHDVSIEEFRRVGAPHIARLAVLGIAQACVPDPDEQLHDLLAAAIAECATVCARGQVASLPPAGEELRISRRRA